MKKLIMSLIVLSVIVMNMPTQVAKACDCKIEKIELDGKEYAFTTFTVVKFKKNYISLKSSINGDVDDYYVGFFVYPSIFKIGDEAIVLYDIEQDFKIVKILGIEYD